ncbi:D-alanyl-D-alanine carboxypeptidase family protein [uncultured Dialister sp.]|uniref:D-alanyl-D-alanine carboxypeptidase family protein n=1 Tax=uncultured Dialister sp. TaxID=278064 RepID=UPI0026356F8E|nr:D-alanyl-D-alanine carboxypeptidase family protein [uncultured Dialister sp.]
MKLKLLLCTLTAALCAACSVEAAPPEITADAAVIMDEKDGTILYEKNGTKREYPASMTKIMTCILSIEKGNPYKTISVSANAADVESTALNGGEWITLDNLRNQMMMISDNGAATAIAENLAGSLPAFAEDMNAKAKEIGMDHTHFVNANGMPDENHYSTAEDMARLARYAMENRTFRRIVSTKYKEIHYERPLYNFHCENSNELLYSYPGATGIKTGYTHAAGGCLAASAIRDNHELIVIVMHSRDMDTRFTEGAALLDYGFRILEGKETAPETKAVKAQKGKKKMKPQKVQRIPESL